MYLISINYRKSQRCWKSSVGEKVFWGGLVSDSSLAVCVLPCNVLMET